MIVNRQTYAPIPKEPTIPGDCLATMGRRQHPDPPAVWCDTNRIALPVSGACLKRVLARWCGKELEPEDVPWLEHQGEGFWALKLPRQRLIVFAPEWHHFGPCIPGLTGEMTRTEALAEIFVWLARLQRLAAKTHSPEMLNPPEPEHVSSFVYTTGSGWALGSEPIDGANHTDDPVVALIQLEGLHGLAEWRVT